MANVKKESASKTKPKKVVKTNVKADKKASVSKVQKKEVIIKEEVDKSIIEKESYMLYFTLTYIVIRLLFNGLNLIPIITKFDDVTSSVLTSFLMIVGTVAAMALNFIIHRKHRVNKHQFNYIMKFMFVMFCSVTLLVNILWIINFMKINALVTIILLVIHAVVIYLYTLVLFDRYVDKK